MRVFPSRTAGPGAARKAPRAGVRTVVAVLYAVALAACDDAPEPLRVAGGDAKLGKQLVEQYQCGSCHAIPDVAAARGNAGPALDGFGRRSYLAGRIPNVPEALTQWLVNPPAMKPGTLMPELGISPDQARHMAAFLYTLR